MKRHLKAELEPIELHPKAEFEPIALLNTCKVCAASHTIMMASQSLTNPKVWESLLRTHRYRSCHRPPLNQSLHSLSSFCLAWPHHDPFFTIWFAPGLSSANFHCLFFANYRCFISSLASLSSRCTLPTIVCHWRSCCPRVDFKVQVWLVAHELHTPPIALRDWFNVRALVKGIESRHCYLFGFGTRYKKHGHQRYNPQAQSRFYRVYGYRI